MSSARRARDFDEEREGRWEAALSRAVRVQRSDGEVDPTWPHQPPLPRLSLPPPAPPLPPLFHSTEAEKLTDQRRRQRWQRRSPGSEGEDEEEEDDCDASAASAAAAGADGCIDAEGAADGGGGGSAVFCRRLCSAGDGHLHLASTEGEGSAQRRAPASVLPPAGLFPSPTLTPRTAVECACAVEGERYPPRLLHLPSDYSATRPFLLPHTSLWTSSTSSSSSSAPFSVHLRVDLPSPSPSRLFQLLRVHLSDVYVNARWREEEAARELQVLSPREWSSYEQLPSIRVQLNEAPAPPISRRGQLRVQGLTVTISPATEPRNANFSEVRVQWQGERKRGRKGGRVAGDSCGVRGDGGGVQRTDAVDERRAGGSAVLYELSLRPVFLRSAEWNGASHQLSVGEVHWSEVGRVRRGVKRPLDEDEDSPSEAASAPTSPLRWVRTEDDDADEALKLQPTLLSFTPDPPGLAAADGLLLSSDSDDEPQLASTSPSAPLSFPFLSDPDYAHSLRLEGVLLFHYRECSVFQRGHEWIQCDACNAYRRLPEWTVMDELPAVWVCRMNPNLLMDDCSRETEEEEIGRRGDWVDDFCSLCERPEPNSLISGFGGWQRSTQPTASAATAHSTGARKSSVEPSAALRHSATHPQPRSSTWTAPTSSAAASSSSSSASPPPSTSAAGAGLGGFPLSSVPPVLQGSPLLGCSGPCCRSFHVDCVGLKGSFPPAAHRQVDREYYCSDCLHGRGTCFACGMRGTEGVELKRCGAVCGKMYHVSCMPPLSSYHRKMRRRLKEAATREAKERAAAAAARKKKARRSTGDRRSNSSSIGSSAPPSHVTANHQRRADSHQQREGEEEADGYGGDASPSPPSDVDVASFICPRHWCAACGESGEDRVLLRCIRCPVAYHCSAPCRPVHVQLVTERSFICSRHGGGGGGEEEKEGKARRRARHVTLSTSPPSRQSRFPQWISRAERREADLGLTIPPSSDGHYQLSPIALRLFPSVLRYHYPSLPLRVSPALLLLSLGRVVSDRSAFHLEWAAFPVGYKVLRTVAMRGAAGQLDSDVSSAVSLTLLCEIIDGGSAPLFRVTPVFLTRPSAQSSSGGGGGALEDVRLVKRSEDGVRDRLIDHVWQKVERSWAQWTRHRYEASQFPIPQEVPAAFHSIRSAAGVVGCSRFGLLHDAITHLIQRMPQTSECHRYNPPQPTPAAAQQQSLTQAQAHAAATITERSTAPPVPSRRIYTNPQLPIDLRRTQTDQRNDPGQRRHKAAGKPRASPTTQPQLSSSAHPRDDNSGAANPSPASSSSAASSASSPGHPPLVAGGQTVAEAVLDTEPISRALTASHVPFPSAGSSSLSSGPARVSDEGKSCPPASVAATLPSEVERPAVVRGATQPPPAASPSDIGAREEEKDGGPHRLAPD